MLPTSTSCRVLPGAVFFFASLQRLSTELPTVQPRSAATLRSDNLRSRLRRHAGDAAGGSIHFSWFFVFLLFFSHSEFFFCLFVSFPCAALASWPRTPACC